jgi:hypothetical protein
MLSSRRRPSRPKTCRTAMCGRSGAGFVTAALRSAGGAAIDALRPHSQWLWQSLPPGEQKRFARHARPWWDVHRHRIAPEVAQQLHDMVAQGRLEIVAGRIQSVEDDGGALVVAYRRRGSSRIVEGTFRLHDQLHGAAGNHFAHPRSNAEGHACRRPRPARPIGDRTRCRRAFPGGRGERGVGNGTSDKGAAIGKSSRFPISGTRRPRSQTTYRWS